MEETITEPVAGARHVVTSPDDPAIHLLIPEHDVDDPEISIVIPALNEELTIVEFVTWCHEGLRTAGVQGEILIIDSGTDRTSELALAGGARVLRTPQRGLGRAYLDAIPFIRGGFVLMGDADCTYDFRKLGPFVEQYRAGYEFVMGTRFKGSIEKGSMPALHQYLGTPVTTWILNRVYSSRFSDIHCGMRGITLDALRRIDLQSQSWEYASEMVLKSVHHELRTTEVPVSFLKDRDGRVSHHKRMGWFSPWQAAWINLRAMFTYGADFFLTIPGLLMTLVGLVLTVPLTFGPVEVGAVTFSLYWMLAGLTLTVVGYQAFLLGGVAQVLYDETGKATARWTRRFAYNRASLACVIMLVAGVALVSSLVAEYVRNDLRLDDAVGDAKYRAVLGLLLVALAFMTFTFTLVIHAAAIRNRVTARTGSLAT